MERIVFQFFLNNGPVLSDKVLKKTLNKSSGEIEAIITRLNSNLAPFSLRIGSTSVNKELTYALVNLKQDKAAEFGTKLSPNEIDFFKKMMHHLIKEGTSSVSIISSSIPHLPNVNINKLLSNLSFAHWIQIEGEDVSIGSRSMVELENYILHISEEIDGVAASCLLCTTLVVGGYKCAYCTCTLHDTCKDEYVTKYKSKMCPQCKREALWMENNALLKEKEKEKEREKEHEGEEVDKGSKGGEDEVDDEEYFLSFTQEGSSGGGRGGKGKKKRRI